eukprot:CAMPEP_0194151090 /NCGR_PEP_ID=MMETSP0152-20130528/46639_1 /TAXON_ID=1049557 /ORGANISM="Thalassiothrix antarctica, Strain L6-D1" /LENGTH=180 /DNA_ID=CAMNT_0038854613 /DNA_START=17 /DNA_END=556 /DNA_ORIENTATION=-
MTVENKIDIFGEISSYNIQQLQSYQLEDLSSHCINHPFPVQSRLDKAEQHLQERIEELGTPDHADLVQDLSALGLLYQHMARDIHKAFYYHMEALRILMMSSQQQEDDNGCLAKYDKSDYDEQLAVILIDLAFVYESLKTQPENALQCFHQAASLLRNMNAKQTNHKLMTCENGIGRLNR